MSSRYRMNSMSLYSTALSSFMSMTHARLVMRSIVNLTSDPIFTPGDMHAAPPYDVEAGHRLDLPPQERHEHEVCPLRSLRCLSVSHSSRYPSHQKANPAALRFSLARLISVVNSDAASGQSPKVKTR